MKSLSFFTILLFLTNLISANLSAQTKISAIQAKLFYNENKSEGNDEAVSGTFSENIIDNANFVLWNTIIGEGSASGYSNQTIVIVEITSKGKSNKNQTLKLTATAEKKVILTQQKTFSTINDKTTYKVLFLLSDTGCEKITLKAEIINAGKSISKLTKIIDFKCGE